MGGTRLAACTVAIALATSGARRGQEPSLASVMDGAATYAVDFQHRLSNIVAEERYVQDITHINLAPGRFAAVTHRELRSDVLLVQPGGAGGYVAFRDVFEVDGRPVRDRQDRLTVLFLNPTASADAQIERINRESARYNIGNVERTINTPTLPLLFLLPDNQPRFRFTRGRSHAPALARAAPDEAWVIEYEEIRRPTLIRTPRGLDLPARGRLWLEPRTGRLLMTELVTDDPTVRATIDVSYQWDPSVSLMVPVEMRERYEGRRDGAVIEGNATYGKVRQFQVRASERIGPAAEPVATVQPATPVAEEERANAQLPAAILSPTAEDIPRPQTFRTRTELVLVDFVVTDTADRPVRGLSARDFVVKEDGKERPIVSFERFAGDEPQAPGAAAAEPAPIARAAAAPPHPATVVLVDDGQLSPQQAARLRPALNALVATAGGRSGSLMLVAPGSNVATLAQLPGGAAELAASVDRIVGRRPDEVSTFPVADAEALAIARGDVRVLARVAARFASLNPEITAEQASAIARERSNLLAHDARARRDVMYDAALRCLDWLAGRPGRHSLIVVSAGVASDPDDSKYYDVVTRSLRANAPIHFLDVRGLPGISRYAGVEYSTGLGRDADEGPFGWAQAAEGATDLADDTGGIAVVNSNDMAKGLGRLLDTMTTYYVLAYQPPAHDKGGYHRIKVEVRGKGRHVRARRGYSSAGNK
jgi:VWFA-related protein